MGFFDFSKLNKLLTWGKFWVSKESRKNGEKHKFRVKMTLFALIPIISVIVCLFVFL